MEKLSFEQAVEKLKRIVKESNIPGQKFLDLSVCQSTERPSYEEAIRICQAKVLKGEISQTDLNQALGLE